MLLISAGLHIIGCFALLTDAAAVFELHVEAAINSKALTPSNPKELKTFKLSTPKTTLQQCCCVPQP